MKKVIYTLALIAGVMSSASSCIGLDTPPYDRETDLTFWSENELAAISTLNSCYTRFYSINQMIESEGATDNAYYKGVGGTQPIGNGSYGTDNGYVKGLWDGFYAGIRTCNELLNNIDKCTSLSDDLRKRYVAEARVIRASHYYELFTRFGGVPYTTEVLTVAQSTEIGITPREEVVANVIAELEAVIAENVLPASYGAGDRGRITSGAAKAILAKVYLFEGNYAKVKTLTDEIMSSGTYKLFPSYEGIFTVDNEQNSEVILDVQYAPVTREWNMRTLGIIPPSMGGYCEVAPTQELVDSYIMLNGKSIREAGSGYNQADPYADRDPRLKMTIIYDGNSYPTAGGETVINTIGDGRDCYGTTSDVTPTGYYLRKWFDSKTYVSSTTSASINAIIIRYADILLMNAEANEALGTLDETVWNNTIKAIRQRAGFTDAGALNFDAGADNKAIIRNERRCELAFEGARFKDIIRWKIAEDVLKGPVHGIYTGEAVGTDNGYVVIETRNFDAKKHYLWPIPQKERDLNKNLDQNPNW